MDPSPAESVEPGASASDGDGIGAAVWGLVRAIGHGTARGVRRLRRWNERDGAGASGLATLVETHALQSAGDATITVALAGSLFFSVPSGEARSRVALYLLITMAPFAVVAPVLGPLLDRFRRGRRTALAVTMIARAILALTIGHAIGHGKHTSITQALTLYPAALGVLVSGKAYNIARSAAVPRLVPEGMTLVQANSRLTLVGVVAPGVAGSFAVAVVKTLGHDTELFLGAVFYVMAAVMAARLPRLADGGRDVPSERRTHGGLVRLGEIGGPVRAALQTAAAFRWLTGFLLLFGAFVVRVHPIGGLSANVCLAELAVGIGVGNLIGVMLGSRLARAAGTSLSVMLLAVAVAVCVYAATSFGVLSVFALATLGSATAAVSKLALDSTIQRTVADDIRTSTFARSETTLQLAWVVGGGVGIVLPTRPGIGFIIAAAVMGAALAAALGFRPRRGPAKSPRPSPVEGS
jgi:MFS family permease